MSTPSKVRRVEGKLNAKEFFIQGCIFRSASGILNATATQDANWHLLIPHVVCCSFSIEIFAKCLCVLDGRNPIQTHNMTELLQDLSIERRSEIKALFNLISLPNLLKTQFASDKPASMIVPLTFEDAVEQSARAFEKWRYIPTAKGPVVFWVRDLAQILQRVIEREHPDWASSIREYNVPPATSPPR